MTRFLQVCCLVSLAWPPSTVAAQGRLAAGGQLFVLRLAEFGVTDVGPGFQAGWSLSEGLALDGALAWFPSGESVSSTLFQGQQRVLGVAGLRAGVSRDRVAFFGRARPGFLRFARQESAVCIAIAIFPTPLGCQLATGYAAFAFDLGGGVVVDIGSSRRAYVRAEAGDVMVRYGLDAFRPRGTTTDGFVGHNLTAAVGVGVRLR